MTEFLEKLGFLWDAIGHKKRKAPDAFPGDALNIHSGQKGNLFIMAEEK